MFYNTYRTTKAAMRERQTANLTGAGQSIINPRERLLNLQKRERLKGLLITKFCRKYGIEHPEEILESEVEKFLNGERLTEADIQRLDAKIRQLLIEKNQLANLQNDLRNQTEYKQFYLLFYFFFYLLHLTYFEHHFEKYLDLMYLKYS